MMMEQSRSIVKLGKNIFKKFSTYIIFLLLAVVCIIISPDFFTPTNITNIGKQYAGLTITSMGMLLVILTGGIDLSVGSIAALGSVITSTCLTSLGFDVFFSIVVALFSGLLLGLITGILVAYAKMAPFIASMAMMTMGRGAAMVIANGGPITTPEGTISVIGKGMLFNAIPVLVIIAFIVVVLFWFIQKYTAFGRIVVAIGSNETSVHIAGLRVKLYKLSVYAISGVCAAACGILICSRSAIGSPVLGVGMELDAIAACVIGGASLNGGEGWFTRTLIGVLILALIGNIMNLLAVPSYPQDIIRGLIIVISVLLQAATSDVKQ
jgi:ribose transport system permease protein